MAPRSRWGLRLAPDSFSERRQLGVPGALVADSQRWAFPVGFPFHHLRPQKQRARLESLSKKFDIGRCRRPPPPPHRRLNSPPARLPEHLPTCFALLPIRSASLSALLSSRRLLRTSVRPSVRSSDNLASRTGALSLGPLLAYHIFAIDQHDLQNVAL